jgi:hypothetical protein
MQMKNKITKFHTLGTVPEGHHKIAETETKSIHFYFGHCVVCPSIY